MADQQLARWKLFDQRLLATMLAIGLLAEGTVASHGVTINVSFDAANSLPEDFPAFDPDASLLSGIVEYAAGVYEGIIEDDHVLDLTYRWDRDLAETNEALNIRTGLHTFQAEEGGRETRALLRFDPDPDWFIDPTPANDAEFDMQQVLYRDLTFQQKVNRFGGDVPEVFEAGYKGDAPPSAPADARNGFDLLTIVFHEMGHALGMSGNLSSLLTETADGDFDVDPDFVGGHTMQQDTRDVDSPNARAHLFGGGTTPLDGISGPAVMATIGLGERRRPSAADILAMSASSNWSEIDLPRKNFLGGLGWHSEVNWVGGAVPSLSDDVLLLNGRSAVLEGPGRANDLLIDEDAQLITGSHGMQVLNTATVGGVGNGELLVGGVLLPASGLLDADRVVVNPTGALTLFGQTSAGDEAVVTGGTVELAGGTILVNSQAAGRIDSSIQVAELSNVSVAGGSRLDISGNLTGSADLVKTGAGELVLAGDNAAWSGDLIIDAGRVVVAPGNGLGNATTVNLRTSDGVLDLTGVGQVFGGVEGDGTVLVGANDVFFGANNSDTVFSGVIAPGAGGVGGFAKIGTGTTTLADAVALDMSRASSLEGGVLEFSGDTIVSTALLEAAGGSTIRIEGDAQVTAFASDFSSPGVFELLGGTFATTAFDGVLLNQGAALTPGIEGDSTRVLNISDNFNNSADSTLQIDVGGLTPGDHDQLSLPIGPPGTGKFAGLGGTLDVNLVDGFIPTLGDTFTIVEARSVGGAFDVIKAPIVNGLTFDVMVVDAGANEMHALLKVVEAPTPGDFDLDGDVDGDDLVQWKGDFGVNDFSDADNDGDSDGVDLLAWQRQFGSDATITTSALAPAPEPSALVLALLAGCCSLRRRSSPSGL